MKRNESFARIQPKEIGYAILISFLVVPAILITLLKSNSQASAISSLQLSFNTYEPLTTVEESNTHQGKNSTSWPLPREEKEQSNPSAGEEISKEGEENRNSTDAAPLDIYGKSEENSSLGGDFKEKLGENKSLVDSEVRQFSHTDERHEQYPTVSDVPIQKGKVNCDFTQMRSDTCSMDGDIRVLGSSSTIIEVSPTQFQSENTTWKIRPYTRKWEATTMESIKEFTLKSAFNHGQIPSCNVRHDITAIVFSTGGFVGNYFHDFSDVVIPLFITSRQYNGKVQFLVTNFNWQWVNKYQWILQRLSDYQVINLDTDNMVHCFPSVHVGLKSHKVLGIDPSKSPNGYSITDFRNFLRTIFSLKRSYTKSISKQSRRKPRLLIVLRKGSRSLTNEKEVIEMARRVGYKVITAGPEETNDLSRFAQVVNSCDVMMGVHGAGLTNMLFLPTNATLIQIIPWGVGSDGCRYIFGEPAPDMGIRYVDYEIGEEESTLIERYPRDHAVFKDPISIHKLGFNTLWSIFLNEQKVKLDVSRFRSLLVQVLHSVKQ
ncbi:beta-1,2-xylosyltransferase XYXT1-like [Typha angustifolia]|uniref:beta-1,2-xylosyltransferase XYXT1-like n=1 Tax=Typha angustifolia TaxID=59011 RepID=UPI003C2CF9AC